MNKRIIFEKETSTGLEKNKFKLEEYFPYREEKYVMLNGDSALNIKSLKIEINTFNIDEAIEFLQKCKEEIKKEEN